MPETPPIAQHWYTLVIVRIIHILHKWRTCWCQHISWVIRLDAQVVSPGQVKSLSGLQARHDSASSSSVLLSSLELSDTKVYEP